MDGAGGAGGLTRADIISLAIRLGVGLAASLYMMKYMIKYLDPNYAVKEQAEKQVRVNSSVSTVKQSCSLMNTCFYY